MVQQRQYFGTDGIRGTVGKFPITPDFILKLGWAVGKVLGGTTGDKVVIGKDTRISGYMFESALEAGLAAAGEDICLLGPMPTPGIAYLTKSLNAHCGIVISASHNPFYDNGIKFFSSTGKKLDDKLECAIETQLQQAFTTVAPENLGKATRINDAAMRYIEFCKSTFPAEINLAGLKIILDCANGATYQIAPIVFKELGATVIETFVHPDGLNINESCGATDLQALQRTVLAEQADLGIAFDGDGDRVMMVDHLGEMVDGDELLFILAKYLHQQHNLGSGVVGTVMTNLGMELALRRLNIPFFRVAVGDRYVLEKMHAQNCILGGESSGHIICLHKTTTGDGIVAALQVLAIMVKTNERLVDLKLAMQKFPQSMINITVKNKKELLNNVDIRNALRDTENQLGTDGRVLLRPSGTEELIRVMVEGVDSQQVNRLAKELAEVVQEASELANKTVVNQ